MKHDIVQLQTQIEELEKELQLLARTKTTANSNKDDLEQKIHHLKYYAGNYFPLNTPNYRKSYGRFPDFWIALCEKRVK